MSPFGAIKFTSFTSVDSAGVAEVRCEEIAEVGKFDVELEEGRHDEIFE